MAQQTQRLNYLIFAYGSNLHLEDLLQWFQDRPELTSPNIIAKEPAWCPNYQPIYHYYSTGRKGGALDLIPALGHVTSGALFTIDAETLASIKRKEGCDKFYEQHELLVLTADGKAHHAITFLTVPSQRKATHTPPTEKYASLVRLGQCAFGHDPIAMEQAAANAPITPIITSLFVYGTLMAQESRSHILSQYKISERNMGKISGRLFDLGSYPGLRPAQEPSDWVYGECIRLENCATALQEIDEIEGFSDFSAPDNLYERRLVYVTLEETRLQLAWVYFYHQEPSEKRIEQGRWQSTQSH